jgi:CubicO group peptidase (beta-lactamase class C family)
MPLSSDRILKIESLITDWIHENDVPGASIVLFDQNSTTYTGTFGARTVDENHPTTTDTLYGMGSVTKPFTALAVLQLANEGRLSPSDSVDEYVDHFAEVPGSPITIGDLLSHTSGMPALGPDRALLGQALGGAPAGVATERDRKRFLRDAGKFRATDEDRFFYSNTGYNILGRIIEAVDGRSFSAYLGEEIFGPLGMDRTTFDHATFTEDEDTATGYRMEERGPTPSSLPFEELLDPSAGIVSSVAEMARFVRAMMRGGSLDGERVASSELVTRLQSQRVVRQTFVDGTERGYGFGWMRQPLEDDEIIGHGGGIGVSSAYVGHLAETNCGVAIACNTVPDLHPTDIGCAVLALASGRPPTAVPAFGLRQKCQSVTGTYESFRDEFKMIVEQREGGIVLRSPEQDSRDGTVAFPANLTQDSHVFYTVTSDGAQRPVEFDLGEEQAEMAFRRVRLQRVS